MVSALQQAKNRIATAVSLWRCLFPQHLLNSLPCRAFFRDTIEETYNNGPPPIKKKKISSTLNFVKKNMKAFGYPERDTCFRVTLASPDYKR
jgi:hypothetical protein